MKLAVQHSLLPGNTLAEKFQKAVDYGFNGIEIVAWGFDSPIWYHLTEIKDASETAGIPISSLCTQRNDDFVHPDSYERKKRTQGLVQYLKTADDLGATGVVALPIRKGVNIPDLSPVGDEFSLTTDLTIAGIQEALSQTPAGKAQIFLEPLNRYETHYLKTIGYAAEFCTNPRVTIMADMFHMSIEEANIANSVAHVIDKIGHLHLADSNRLEPGQGHTHFGDVFSVLKQAKYSGWMAFECGLSGSADEVLPQSVKLLRQWWEEA